jgi:hypothetical protein
LRARPEQTQLEDLSDVSFLGKLVVLPANVRLDWKVFARCKHSSLFGLVVGFEEKKFYNIDSRTETRISRSASAKQVLDFDDIARLDIKTSLTKNVETSQVDDIFADMTPVISEAPKFDASAMSKRSKSESTLTKSKFDVVATHDAEDEGDGWGGDGWD